jgi:hypothetical protein
MVAATYIFRGGADAMAVSPVTSVWSELNRDLTIEKVEVSLALGFEAEGNVFIARGSGSANVSFKLSVRPSDPS